jgi:hypothetical protein
MSTTVGERFEVEDLDADDVLAFMRDLDLEARRIEAWKLRAAAHWADLHPATTDTGAAAPDGSVLDHDETLGGDGTPSVAAFTPEELGVVLRVSPSSAAALVADALDLRHRFPMLWTQVMRCEVPAWLARRVAQQTRALPQAGAAYVDDTLAARTTPWGTGVLDRVVAHAIAKFSPPEHTSREEQAQATWGIELRHPTPTECAGTSELIARGDTLLLQRVYDQIHDTARDHGIPPIEALAQLVDGGQPPGTSPSKTRLYLHIDATDLDHDTTSIGTVEKLGPATTTKIRQWVGHSRVTIVPVLDLDRDDPVDHHDPPHRMREHVILRDRHCVFPGCTRDARSCDLDHIEPYLDPGDGGPPGQTRPTNLAPLCRRHHRAKTTGLWRYTRTPDGRCLWRGPYGVTFLASP